MGAFQPDIQRLNVTFVQRTGIELQIQQRQNVVITGVSVVSASTKQQTLGIQNLDDIARADFITGLRRFQRALDRSNRLLASTDILNGCLQLTIQAANLLLDLTTLGLQLEFRRRQISSSLLALTVQRTTGKNRYRNLYTIRHHRRSCRIFPNKRAAILVGITGKEIGCRNKTIESRRFSLMANSRFLQAGNTNARVSH